MEFKLNYLTVSEWMALCDILLLDMEDCVTGYSSALHRYRIAHTLDQGPLFLSRNQKPRASGIGLSSSDRWIRSFMH